MEQLTYKLEVFEGPLETLLYLISKNKLDICDIPIAELLDQYMGYLHAMQEMDLEITSDFLEMASRLVQIKAAMLLPRYEEEEGDDPRAELMASLIEYQTCKAMAEALRKLEGGVNRMAREPMKLEHAPAYSLRHNTQELLDALLSSLSKSKRRQPPSVAAFKGVVGRPVVSVASRVVHVLRQLIRCGTRPIGELFESVRARSEAVATFLAVLELIRSHEVALLDTDGTTFIEIKRKKRALSTHGNQISRVGR